MVGPSNNATESTFNGLKLIHNDQRNRLGKEKIQKLLKVWFNGKVIDREQKWMKQYCRHDNVDYRSNDLVKTERDEADCEMA